MRHAVKTLADAMAERMAAERKPKPQGVSAKRKAILRSQIEIACRGAAEFIDDLAALIKDSDSPNLPVDNIRMMLERGECPCRAALRLLSEEN